MKFSLLLLCLLVGFSTLYLHLFEIRLSRGRISDDKLAQADELVDYWYSLGKPFCIEGEWNNKIYSCNFPFKVKFDDLPMPTTRPTRWPTPTPTNEPRHVILVDLRDVKKSPDFYVDAIDHHYTTESVVFCFCDSIDCESHLLFYYYDVTIVFDVNFAVDVVISENDTPIIEPCLSVVSGSYPEVTERLTRMMNDLSYFRNIEFRSNDVVPSACERTSLLYIWVDPARICGDDKCVTDQLTKELSYINNFTDIVVVDFDDFVFQTEEVIRPLVLALGRANFGIRSFPDLDFFSDEYDMEFDYMVDWFMGVEQEGGTWTSGGPSKLYNEIKSKLI